jgi:hypothetical protein
LFSSANCTNSAGVLDLRSWSFISRMGGIDPWESDRRSLEKCEDSQPMDLRREIAGLG